MYTVGMYFVLGLGNPGTQYEYTRHNVAWMMLEKIFEDFEDNKYLQGVTQHNDRFLVLLPHTFMNKSGESVMKLKKHYEDFDPKRLIVVHDDVDLALGTIRISFDRGSGGHNGVRSIMQKLDTRSFIRIRVGVAQYHDEVLRKPSVLGRFQKQEEELIYSLVPKFKEILDTIYEKGVEAAMNAYNKKTG